MTAATKRATQASARASGGGRPRHRLLRGQRVQLLDRDLLGAGGEARVFRVGPEAVKVFHDVPAGLGPKEASLFAAMADLRARKILDFPAGLPTAIVGPTAPLLEEGTNDLVGYAMPLVGGAQEVAKLAQRKWRQGVMSAGDVLALFRALHGALAGVHAAGVVVGDLNDGNVLFRGIEPFLIDADSMQLGGLPCPVGHERTLDPQLYGQDLTSAPRFTPETDWYAFSVLLFSSLLYVHPYGGVHKNLPTLLRRAEAGHSLLRSDVQAPRHAVPTSALDDDLLELFTRVFDMGARGVFPPRLLDARFSACASCGVEHARARCPVCATAAPALPAVVVRGRCRETLVLETRGAVVAAVMQGKLRWLVEERGALHREDGSVVLAEPRRPGLELAIAGSRTWLAEAGRLAGVEGGKLVERASSGTTPAGHTAYAATGGGLLRTEGDVLVHHEPGRQLGRIFDGQTRLFGHGPLVFGCYQAGRIFHGFLVDPTAGALRDLPPLDVAGRVVAVEAASEADHLLVALATEEGGKRRHHLRLFDRRGRLRAHLSGAPDEHAALAYLGGKAVRAGRVLAATPAGLTLLEPEPAATAPRLLETRSFPDSSSFVSGDVDLLPGPSGTVYVVTTQAITQLSLS